MPKAEPQTREATAPKAVAVVANEPPDMGTLRSLLEKLAAVRATVKETQAHHDRNADALTKIVSTADLTNQKTLDEVHRLKNENEILELRFGRANEDELAVDAEVKEEATEAGKRVSTWIDRERARVLEEVTAILRPLFETTDRARTAAAVTDLLETLRGRMWRAMQMTERMRGEKAAAWLFEHIEETKAIVAARSLKPNR